MAQLLEIKRKNKFFYKSYVDIGNDEKVVAKLQNIEYELKPSTFGSGYYEGYLEPRELGFHLLEIYVNGEKQIDEIVKVVVVKPENQYKIMRK